MPSVLVVVLGVRLQGNLERARARVNVGDHGAAPLSVREMTKQDRAAHMKFIVRVEVEREEGKLRDLAGP